MYEYSPDKKVELFKSMRSNIITEQKKWAAFVNALVTKTPELHKEFVTISGMKINRLYTPTDISKLDYMDMLGFPGEYPFTRGVQPTMYRGRLWTMRQYAGFGSAEDTNRRYKYLLSQGQTGLSVAFDLPTQLGYDSDNPRAHGEVGKVGVAVSSLKDMQTLFAGIRLADISTSMTINATAPILLAMYLVVAELGGAKRNGLAGTVQNDILKEYIARGTYIFPPQNSLRLVTDIFEFCSKEMPRWNSISISGYHIREAGSTAVQEIAFTLANAIAYVQSALNRGLEIDKFAPRLSFFFNVHIDFFEEIAKLRAARRLWARLMKERFHAKDPRSMMMRFHVQTAGCSLTAQQPENNIVRVTLQALAAVLGGAQSIHTNSMDEAYALPSEKAVRIALRTQQIIGYETGVTNTVDPVGGSYFIEYLTNEIEEAALKYIERIDRIGGMIRAIEAGYPQREIANAAYEFQKKIESGERVVVGVNRFKFEETPVIDTLRINPEIEREQVRKLRALRTARDKKAVSTALEKLRDACKSEKNVMPALIEGVKAYATLGELCDVMRECFGEYDAPTVI